MKLHDVPQGWGLSRHRYFACPKGHTHVMPRWVPWRIMDWLIRCR